MEETGTDNRADRQQASRLSDLARASRQINGLLPLDWLLSSIADEATRLLQADRTTIFLHDPARDRLVSRVGTGLAVEEIVIGLDQGAAGDAFTRAVAVRIPDAYADGRFCPVIDRKLGYHTRNVLAVPLPDSQGKTLGVFEALNKHEGPFTDADEQIATTFAAQVGVAIEISRLFECFRDDQKQLVSENARLRRQLKRPLEVEPFLGQSPAVREVLRTVDQISGVCVNVMITGQTGTGKTLLARVIHNSSSRRSMPLLTLNCAALPETLLESELFGIESGVATGVSARVGKLEQAAGGTLFLDEVADMSPATQAKILRAAQSGEYERVGGRQTLRSDARLISATNKELAKEMAEGRFRQDLFYRLNVVTLHLPPLRQRAEDIPMLASFLLDCTRRRFGKEVTGFEPGVLDRFAGYPWPGNVRELENEIQRAVALAPAGGAIGVEHLSPAVAQGGPPPDPGHAEGGPATLPSALEALQGRMIADALRVTGNNKAKAAINLGISREGLRKIMARLQIPG